MEARDGRATANLPNLTRLTPWQPALCGIRNQSNPSSIRRRRQELQNHGIDERAMKLRRRHRRQVVPDTRRPGMESFPRAIGLRPN